MGKSFLHVCVQVCVASTLVSVQDSKMQEFVSRTSVLPFLIGVREPASCHHHLSLTPWLNCRMWEISTLSKTRPHCIMEVFCMTVSPFSYASFCKSCKKGINTTGRSFHFLLKGLGWKHSFIEPRKWHSKHGTSNRLLPLFVPRLRTFLTQKFPNFGVYTGLISLWKVHWLCSQLYKNGFCGRLPWQSNELLCIIL